MTSLLHQWQTVSRNLVVGCREGMKPLAFAVNPGVHTSIPCTFTPSASYMSSSSWRGGMVAQLVKALCSMPACCTLGTPGLSVRLPFLSVAVLAEVGGLQVSLKGFHFPSTCNLPIVELALRVEVDVNHRTPAHHHMYQGHCHWVWSSHLGQT